MHFGLLANRLWVLTVHPSFLMTPKLIRARLLSSSLLTGVLLGLAVHAFAAVGVDWTLRNPSLTSESFNGIARNGDARHTPSVLVAVGSHGLIVSASNPAGPWTVRASGTTENLNAVTWSASSDPINDSPVSLFVAVGDKGVVLTSGNGITWTKLAGAGFTDPAKPVSPPGNQLLSNADLAAQDFVCVFCTSSQFFIGGNSSAGPVVYSSNAGSAWRKYPGLGAGLKMRSVAGSLTSKVVAVTNKNIQSASATAPSTWTTADFPTGETACQSIIFNNNKYILSGAKTYTSPNPTPLPKDWAPQTLADTYLNLTLNLTIDRKYIGVGASGTMWTSVDGTGWTPSPVVPVEDTGLVLHGAVDFGNEYVAVGDGGRIYRQSSGTWTSVYSAGATDHLSTVAVNGSALVALGKNVAMSSTDGINWTRATTTVNPSSVMGVGAAGFLATGTGIWTSPDGLTWTESVAPAFTGRLNRVIPLIAPGEAMAVGADTSAATLASLVYLYNGTAWTKAALPAGSAKELRGAAASASVTVTVGDGGLVLTSLNRTLWTKRQVVLPVGENFTDVLFTRTLFVAGTSAGGTWTSPDGIVWTKRQAGGAAGISKLVRAAINPDSLIVGVGGAGMTLRSYSGIYWYGSNSGTSQALRDAVWTGSQIVAVGTNGTILTSGGAITPQPKLQFVVDSSSVLESAGTAIVQVKLSAASPLPVTVTFSGSTSTKVSTDMATLGTTATTDYGLPAPAVLTFQPNETQKTIVVTIRQDTADEVDEKAVLTLSPPAGDVVLGPVSQHTLTITD
ncbi:MAG: hypothetical protein JWO08_139, partial [Verrucomicrobiaceae bacterium]|nr:hypothetical protein [Verrucomicrobiaceae bacterium]